MGWIKAILEKHIKEDGTIDMTKAMDEVNKEFPKNAVPKEIFNQKNDDLKVANKLVDDLKKDNKDVEDLQEKIDDYEKEVEGLKEERVKEKTNYTLRERLKEAGAKDVDYMIYKLGEVELDKEGNIIELDNKIKSLVEENKDHFEVKEDKSDKDDDKNKGPGYEVIDNKLEDGDESTKEPETLADAIKSQYEEK